MSGQLEFWQGRYTLITLPCALVAGVTAHFDIRLWELRDPSPLLAGAALGFSAAAFLLSPLVRNPRAPAFVIAYLLLIVSVLLACLVSFGTRGISLSIFALMWVHLKIFIYYPLAVISVLVLRRFAGRPLREMAISVAEAERRAGVSQ